MKKLLAVVSLMFALCISVFSQEHTLDVEDNIMTFDSGIFDSSPFVRLDLGVAQPLYRSFQGDALDQFFLVLGFERFKDHGESLIKHTNYGLYGVGLLDNTELLATQTDGAQQFNLGAIGFTTAKGYGWKLGESSRLILGIEDGIGLAQLGYNYDVPDNPLEEILTDLNSYEKLKATYGDGTRLTNYFRSYIKYQPTELVSLDVSYGRQLVYPRVLFWYWTLSGIVSGTADGLANLFISRVMKSYEDAVPIVHFLLKTGLAFGFYQLQKDNMHWPINTAPALITNNFNIGMTFHL
ncbi:MAG: hypothetical protein Kapaf2KO_21580 [Candidatus Kapaibacteriales bacterium]